jgi:pimeloyl-ACP methyl ester carboxylesterase
LEIKSSADFVRMTRAALAVSGFERREVDGTVYWTSGQRAADSAQETLVLIHGVNDQAGSWFAVAPSLAQTYRVIVPDLAGHGESDPSAGPLPISLLVERLHAVIGRETAGPITLLGNSLGGWIAMLYTLAHRDRVSRLVLESAGGLNRPLVSPMVARDRDEALVILRNVHGPRYTPPEWVVDALLLRAADSPMLRMTELVEHFLEDRLGDIRVPTAVLWGADDGVVPRDYAEALRDGIRGSTLHVIEGAAHIPHMQQPERFLACLTAIS